MSNDEANKGHAHLESVMALAPAQPRNALLTAYLVARRTPVRENGNLKNLSQVLSDVQRGFHRREQDNATMACKCRPGAKTMSV